jgi:hypothetical protein
MRKIQLTMGLFALVDNIDYAFLQQYKWYAKVKGRTYYAATWVRNREIKMHRFILACGVGVEVDHIDRNGLNNQRKNLRTCTHLQNCSNRSAYGKSKYLGVYLDKGKYWRSQIYYNGKRYAVGSFLTEVEAARAYDLKAIELKGEFANLNFKLNEDEKLKNCTC